MSESTPRCPGPIACDLARQTLAESEAQLRERVADLQQDVVWYRAIALEGIHALHHLLAERDRLQDALYTLVDVPREQRAARARRPDPLLNQVWRRRGAVPPAREGVSSEERIQ